MPRAQMTLDCEEALMGWSKDASEGDERGLRKRTKVMPGREKRKRGEEKQGGGGGCEGRRIQRL